MLLILQGMTVTYLKRAILWFKELTLTLIKFWVKNPRETPAIISFVLEKLFASPRFILKNVFTEKYATQSKHSIKKTVRIYNKIGKEFNPNDPKSYEVLKSYLSSKSQLLYFLVRKLKPKIAVETGVAAGESTGYILQGLFDNGFGKLYSIDLPFQWYIYGNRKLHLDSLPAGKMPGYLIPEKLKKNWQLILGNTYQKLPTLLLQLGRIDFFLHDSEHSDKTMMFEYKSSWPYIKKGGLLLSDDVSYTKAFDDFAKNKRLKKIIFKDLGVIKNNG